MGWQKKAEKRSTLSCNAKLMNDRSYSACQVDISAAGPCPAPLTYNSARTRRGIETCSLGMLLMNGYLRCEDSRVPR
jgi:hypothetical protein